LSVLLLDRQVFPRWKVCGACLSRGTLDLLARAGMGSLAEDHGAVPLDRLHLQGWNRRAVLTLPGSMALSRKAFDGALVLAACRAGAVFVDGVRATPGSVDPTLRRVQVRGPSRTVEVAARVVVAADGLGGSFAVDPTGSGREVVALDSRVGVGGVFPEAVPGYAAGTIHMVVGSAGYVGLTRIEDGRLNVAAALDVETLRRKQKVHDVVSRILAEAGARSLPDTPEQGWTGTVPLTRRPLGLGAERLFVVGDAAGYLEPFTGEGMTWAIGGAQALVPLVERAVVAWAPETLVAWERWHRRRLGGSQRLCRAAAWTLRRPGLSRGTLGLLRRFPGVARPFIRRAANPPLIPQQSTP
jgi:flavin-dependent dehydrogenase